jgi:glycosyltransferase involved in cell wall biosynthesis
MILCVMRLPPAPNGHGGSQRAWFLLQALCRLGPVHFVLVSRKRDKDAATVPLDPIAPMVRSVTSIDIPEWEPTRRRTLGPLDARWHTLATMRSQEAPRISQRGLERIAEQLPIRSADIVFAGRLPTAVIMQALIDRGLLKAGFRFVDFDDIMSKFKERELSIEGPIAGHQGRMLLRLDAAYIRAAERRIATGWDGVSVCADEDVRALEAAYPAARVVKIPNVVERELQAPRPANGGIRLLFPGNLAFLPNVQGLATFLREAWASVKRTLPDVSLNVVGMHPGKEMLQLVEEYGLELHQNVPEMRPFYRESDIVLSPIFIGSGTRIKILEAMAYGRPVVTTSMGAEGLGLVHGRHAMIADDMTEFANAVVALASDEGARHRMAEEARSFQEKAYGVSVLNDAVASALRLSPPP